MKGLFITGTDTDVGKTYISCLIAAELNSRNINVVPRKPVESGCHRDGDKLIPHDATALKNAANYSGSLEQVCPYRFEQAISPQRAAKLNHQIIKLENLTAACKQGFDKGKDYLLVEGAGGFYSPLCRDGLNADLAKSLGLAVVVIAEDKIGCINQVLLTVEAIESRGLQLQCVFLNQTKTPTDSQFMNNVEDLSERLSCPVFLHSYQSPKLPTELVEILF